VVKKTLFGILAVFLVLFMLEASFRVFYSIKYRNFAYMAFGLGDIFKFNVDRFNEYLKLREPPTEGSPFYLGFRTEPFSVEKPDDEYRIVALGGSSVYGLYDGYYKSWPYLLQQELKKRRGDYRYRVINAGIPGQTTYGVNRLLSEEALKWDPDEVIIYSLYNHVDIDMVAFYRKEKGDYFFRLLKALLYDKSLVATHLVDFIGSRSGLLRGRIEKYRYLIADMIERCKEKNVGIIIVKQLAEPGFFDTKYNAKCNRGENKHFHGKYYSFLEVIDEVCGEYGCPVVDFSASSPMCRDRVGVLLRDHVVHLSDQGKELLASAVAAKITESVSK
jgi:lysophospholipase L1-like esterase